MIIAVAVVPRF